MRPRRFALWAAGNDMTARDWFDFVLVVALVCGTCWFVGACAP